MRDALMFLAVFGMLPFVLTRPWFGVLVWSWLGFMSPHRLTWGAAYEFPFSAIVAACLIFSVVFSKERKRMLWSPVTVTWILFFLWTVLTMAVALVPEDASREWGRWWKINLICLIILLVMQRRERLDMLIWVIVVSLGFYGVKGGIFAIVTAGEYMVIGPPGSFIDDNTNLGLALIMTLPLMRYLHLEAQRIWVKRGLFAAMGLTTLAIIATHSRGALLGIIAMAGVLVLKSKQRLRIGLVVLLAIPAIFSFMPDHWFERMETIKTFEEDGSAMGRINAWWFAYNVASDRPLVGGGFGVFDKKLFRKYAPEPEDFHDSHSIYFEILGEQGFVGLALFLLLGFFTYRAASRLIRATADQPGLSWANHMASMLQVSLVGYWVCGAFLGHAYFDFYYTLITLVVIARELVKRELAAETSSQPVADGQKLLTESDNRGFSW